MVEQPKYIAATPTSSCIYLHDGSTQHVTRWTLTPDTTKVLKLPDSDVIWAETIEELRSQLHLLSTGTDTYSFVAPNPGLRSVICCDVYTIPWIEAPTPDLIYQLLIQYRRVFVHKRLSPDSPLLDTLRNKTNIAEYSIAYQCLYGDTGHPAQYWTFISHAPHIAAEENRRKQERNQKRLKPKEKRFAFALPLWEIDRLLSDHGSFFKEITGNNFTIASSLKKKEKFSYLLSYYRSLRLMNNPHRSNLSSHAKRLRWTQQCVIEQINLDKLAKDPAEDVRLLATLFVEELDFIKKNPEPPRKGTRLSDDGDEVPIHVGAPTDDACTFNDDDDNDDKDISQPTKAIIRTVDSEVHADLSKLSPQPVTRDEPINW